MHKLMTDAKIFDPKGNELVKLPFFNGNAIVDNAITIIAEECCWLHEVNGCKMFLLVIARRYSTFDLQNLLIPSTLGKNISKYQDGVVFGRIVVREVVQLKGACKPRGCSPTSTVLRYLPVRSL